MRSIKGKIICAMVSLITATSSLLVVFSSFLSYKSAVDSTEYCFNSMSELSSQRIQWQFNSYINVAIDTGYVSRLSSPSVSDEDKIAIINSKIDIYNFSEGGFADKDGNSPDGKNYADTDYFQAAMRGETHIVKPNLSEDTGELEMLFSAPIWDEGNVNTTPVGVVFFSPDSDLLNDIMRSIKISENSDAYIIDSDGNTIADVNTQLVKDGENIEELAKNDNNNDGYDSLAKIHSKMRNGEHGFDSYKLNGVKKYIAYSPIKDTDGWSLAIYAPEKDFLNGTFKSIFVTVLIMIICTLITIVVSIVLANSIGNPMRQCSERMKKLVDGDLKSPVPVVKGKTETAVLADATSTVVSCINGMIADMRRILGAMADGNFNIDTENSESLYVGDFNAIIKEICTINEKLSSTMSQINIAADQVNSGSDNVASGAQELSQGATEQASAVDQLASTIRIISGQISNNSSNCSNAHEIVNDTVAYIKNANNEMKNLTDAMNNIDDKSGQIRNIIKTIEDIAFQTNILALNAAVEAARAGEAGKGFAVVSNEVRNLASKSANAAKDTTVLIEQSITAVENGTSIVASAVDVMNKVGEKSNEVESIVHSIAEASRTQAEMIEQISTGIDQISSVVQTNSATSEESAAASEQLLGQATALKDLISTFTLKEE